MLWEVNPSTKYKMNREGLWMFTRGSINFNTIQILSHLEEF